MRQQKRRPSEHGMLWLRLGCASFACFCLPVPIKAQTGACPSLAEPGCFDQDFPCETCCDTRMLPIGDLKCWVGNVKFATCCGLTRLRMQAEEMLPKHVVAERQAECPPAAQHHCFDSYFTCERCCDTRKGGQGDMACWPDTSPYGLRTLSFGFCCGLQPFQAGEILSW
mmetsp:Transcript_28162/g.54273  ORF Transcript_28162/g.54273 Transcript_28162/m.54273 type:complete len:169 (+) Transcript_28162:87-593(+)